MNISGKFFHPPVVIRTGITSPIMDPVFTLAPCSRRGIGAEHKRLPLEFGDMMSLWGKDQFLCAH